jgi:hypothetical protein
VTKLSEFGSALLYSTFLGGGPSEDLQEGHSIAVDDRNDAYVTGWTDSSSFPAESPLYSTLGGGSDAFVTKLSEAAQPNIRIEPNSLSFDMSSLSVTSGSQLSVRPPGASTPQVLLSNNSSLILDFVVPMAESSEVEINDEIYQRLLLPGEGLTDEIGRPQLPALGRWIAIPTGTSATIQILNTAFTVLHGYKIYPAQEPLTDQGPIEPGFSLDTDFYQRDAFYPQPLVVLEPPVDLRRTQGASLRVYPFQHNPRTGALRVYSHVRVKINFVQDSTVAGTDLRPRSLYFDEMYRSLLLNYDETLAPPPSLSAMSQNANGCDFLIITAPQFETHANALATWRNQQGIVTQVRTTDDTGTTAAAIQAYIQDAYDTWSPQPSFVLLLGDAEFIPPHYRTTHPYYGTELGTDLYYSTVDGADYFPDISLGRISVDTAVQAGKIISDIIDYERNPVTDAGFYSRVAVAGYFQDRDTLSAPKDGYEDRRFVLTSQEIRDYLITQGYNVQRIYTTESSVNPTHYNNGTYANGEPLPAELLRANGFPWDGDRTDISNAVNAGVFILNHRDHGAFWGWGDPRFTVGDVNSLTNGDKLPVVFSINCETGWFDNETDHSSHSTGRNDICFAEAWQRNPNGGAVGVIASTRVSYSGHNDTMVKGFYDAIWPSFLPYTPSPGRFSDPQRHMGNVLNYGKLYYASQYGDSSLRKVEFEEFHYFGDPTTRIWTAPPSRTQKTFTIYNDGDADLRVTEITKQNNSCWLDVATGSGFPLVVPPSGSKIVVVTVAPDCTSAGTHNDRLLVYSNDPNESPYPDGVNVSLTVPSLVEVSFADSDVDSDSGNENGVANPGERITMDIALRNLGNDVATDVSVVLSSTSPYVDILDANVFYSVVGQDPVEGDENDTVQFEISPDTPGGTVIIFNLEISASNGGPWQHEFAVVVAPDTTPPNVPSSPSPVDGASGQSLNVSLTWTGGDPDGDQVTYDVYVSTEHPLADLSRQDIGCIGVTTPRCDVELAPGTKYFWYIVSTDEHNATTSGPVWSLTTVNQVFLPVVLRQHS